MLHPIQNFDSAMPIVFHSFFFKTFAGFAIFTAKQSSDSLVPQLGVFTTRSNATPVIFDVYIPAATVS